MFNSFNAPLEELNWHDDAPQAMCGEFTVFEGFVDGWVVAKFGLHIDTETLVGEYPHLWMAAAVACHLSFFEDA